MSSPRGLKTASGRHPGRRSAGNGPGYLSGTIASNCWLSVP